MRDIRLRLHMEVPSAKKCHIQWPQHLAVVQTTLLLYINDSNIYTRAGTLIVATIYLQLIQNRYMFRSFTVLHCCHQHCVQPVTSDVEVVGYF